MPKVGFKSITIHGEIYDRWEKIYRKNKKLLALKGINSFSGFITSKLYILLSEEEIK